MFYYDDRMILYYHAKQKNPCQQPVHKHSGASLRSRDMSIITEKDIKCSKNMPLALTSHFPASVLWLANSLNLNPMHCSIYGWVVTQKHLYEKPASVWDEAAYDCNMVSHGDPPQCHWSVNCGYEQTSVCCAS